MSSLSWRLPDQQHRRGSGGRALLAGASVRGALTSSLPTVHLRDQDHLDAEQRRHMMHGFTQLVPLRGVPLSLVSIQLTRSNSEGGRTAVHSWSRTSAPSPGGHRPKVDDALEAIILEGRRRGALLDVLGPAERAARI